MSADSARPPQETPERPQVAAPASLPPRVSWQEFTSLFRWEQGAHLTTVGPNGWGKTTLIQQLLDPSPLRAPTRYVAVLSTKKRDPVIDDFRQHGFSVRRKWDIPDADLCPRVVLAPKLGGFATMEAQRSEFLSALDAIYRQGSWTIVMDEGRILSDNLRLRQEIEVLLSQGRSHGITVVFGTQRPRHVPLLTFDMPRHLFFGQDNDRTNVRRYAEISGGPDPRELHAAINSLDLHEWLYVDTEPGGLGMLRTKVDVE